MDGCVLTKVRAIFRTERLGGGRITSLTRERSSIGSFGGEQKPVFSCRHERFKQEE